MKIELANLVKFTVATGGAALASTPVFKLFTTYVNMPVWGVPVTLWGAAAAGSILSLFFGDPITTRRMLFGQTMAAMFFGVGLAVLASDAMNWEWATKNLSMFAMMSAAMLRWFLPSLIIRGKQLIHTFSFSFTKKRGDDK